MDKVLESMEEWASHPENIKKIEKMQDKFVKDMERKDRYVEKLHSMSLEERDAFIMKCIDKYDSEEYKDREYNAGYEPRCPLYNVIFDYAEKYGEDVRSYVNRSFLAARYKFDNWIVELYIGQGSFISIHNIDPDYELHELTSLDQRCQKPVEQFIEDIKEGYICDFDGHGYYGTATKISNIYIDLDDLVCGDYPKWVTHIYWYNS